jgi:hypothetical protein
MRLSISNRAFVEATRPPDLRLDLPAEAVT